MVENGDCLGTPWYFVLVVQEKLRHFFFFFLPFIAARNSFLVAGHPTWCLFSEREKIMNETIFLGLDAFLKRLLRDQME